jgi:regulator of replication initiation timing
MTKNEIYNQELERINKIFEGVDESVKELNRGLIHEAAFLFAENQVLRELLDKTGMIKINPDNPTMQKPIPAAKEYRQNLNTYATVIKSLSSALVVKQDLDDDDLEEYE